MEMAIMQDPKDSDKSTIIFLSLTSAFIVAGISGLMGTFLSTESRYELFLIIFCAFIASIQNMATSVANLKERYWAIAISRLLFPFHFCNNFLLQGCGFEISIGDITCCCNGYNGFIHSFCFKLQGGVY